MIGKRPTSSRETLGEVIVKKRPRRGLQSLARTVSPPLGRKKCPSQGARQLKSAAAAVGAGAKAVENHLDFNPAHLHRFIKSQQPGHPRILSQNWTNLYNKNAGTTTGRHFVVHQHDHPVAGTHYDLRLQCNPTSSISFAIMYGLPGNPNSRRLNRNATETRVHCLWNHLIETASHTTGSMLIWDTGEYEVLPSQNLKGNGSSTDDDHNPDLDITAETQQAKLKDAFQNRKIKLRLHGVRLPANYTISLRLTKENQRTEQPHKPSRRRIRKTPQASRAPQTDESASESEHLVDSTTSSDLHRSYLQMPPLSSPQITKTADVNTAGAIAIASDEEDEMIRVNNAYSGATNDVGSVHQRKWYLSIDRRTSGFAQVTKMSSSGFLETSWMRTTEEKLGHGVLGQASGFESFVVGGRDTEASVVTGRLAKDILMDEGVVGYMPRGRWRPVLD